MEFDNNKIDEAALALLSLTLHDEVRAWKGLDWDISHRLYEKGLITDPRNKNKSIVFTEAGLAAALQASEKLFKKS